MDILLNVTRRRISVELLKNKFLLLDTNILIEATKAPQTLRPFFEFVAESECGNPLIIDAVYFEFIRNARSRTEYDQTKEMLDGYDKILTTEEDVEKAIQISLACVAKKPGSEKQISYTDCLLGAQLAKYGDKIILATINYNDFPLYCYDRIHVQVYDLESKIITISFIQFNHNKFDKCMEVFESKKRKK